MEEELLQKTFDEVAALKDLFMRRLMEDKVKSVAIIQLKDNNDALIKQLSDKSIQSFVKEILLVIDRIDAQDELDDMTLSVKEELLEVLARREIVPMPDSDVFDPSLHNAAGTVEADETHVEKSIVKVIKKGYMREDKVFRPAEVIVAVSK